VAVLRSKRSQYPPPTATHASAVRTSSVSAPFPSDSAAFLDVSGIRSLKTPSQPCCYRSACVSCRGSPYSSPTPINKARYRLTRMVAPWWASVAMCPVCYANHLLPTDNTRTGPVRRGTGRQ
jgi:hypothetical protein